MGDYLSEGCGMTSFQNRALEILMGGPIWPEDFYLRMWPNGRCIRITSKATGGPNRAACATNWALGKLEQRYKWCRRKLEYTGRYGRWEITHEGRAAISGRDAA